MKVFLAYFMIKSATLSFLLNMNTLAILIPVITDMVCQELAKMKNGDSFIKKEMLPYRLNTMELGISMVV